MHKYFGLSGGLAKFGAYIVFFDKAMPHGDHSNTHFVSILLPLQLAIRNHLWPVSWFYSLQFWYTAQFGCVLMLTKD